jgi:hypothetical protein
MMHMHSKTVQIIVLFLLPSMVLAQKTNSQKGLYANSAVSIWGSREITVPSPDGNSIIVVQPPLDPNSDETHHVTVHSNGQVFKTEIGSMVNAEVAWSPDSKAFFITYSSGGNIGRYHVKVGYVTNTGLHVIEPIANGRKLFAPKCFDPEYPNVGAIKWVGTNSEHLLIAIEVPPHSSCASLGTFRAFKIILPSGKVVRQYDQITAKKLFAVDLGEELSGADDDCIRKPQTCIPPGLK